MKIKSIHLQGVGPVSDRCFDFSDEWRGGLHHEILFSGCNGSGKSTILRAVANLWQAAGQWLSTPGQKIRYTLPAAKWLSRWKSCAVLLDDVREVGQLGIYWGDPARFEELQAKHSEFFWLGETRQETGRRGRPAKMLIHRGAEMMYSIASYYRELTLAGVDRIGNMLHLDGEERRWVTPVKGVGEVVADDPQLQWLVNYRANEEWKGQLEASLIALKTVDPDKYVSVLKDLNALLVGKSILFDPDKDTLRLRVELSSSQTEHTLDDLSAGEHQVLIQLYLVSRFLKPGGVVMIDEPDLHLHPSLVSAFLARLEAQVKERDGQLILTSHNPAIWERYENKALRIQLDHGKGDAE